MFSNRTQQARTPVASHRRARGIRHILSTRTLSRGVVAGLTVALLTGCGFHLRGKVDLSSNLTPLAIAGNDVELISVIREALEFSEAQVVDEASSAQAVLRLRQSDYTRNVRTTDGRGLATSYLLIYRVRFDAVNRDGKVVMQEGSLRLTRDLDFDANQILQKESEQRFLIEDMQREIAQNILRRLSSVANAGEIAAPARSRLVRATDVPAPDAG